jgi:D-Tyr-tRNAtyr deacylase
MRWHLHKSQSFVDAQVLSFAITDSAEIAAEAAETTSAVVLISEIAQTVRKNVIIVNRASVEHGVFEALLYISEQNQGPR